jgi:hypothetical protein
MRLRHSYPTFRIEHARPAVRFPLSAC